VSTAFTDLQRSSISRIEKLFDPGRSMTGRTSGRSDLALGGWYIFLENPLGVGTGGFGKAWANLGRREGLSEFRRGVEFQAHSAWVKVLVENGVPGAVLLAAFILSFTAAGLTSPIRGAASLGLLVTITISTALLSTEFQSKGVWFLAAGATVVLSLRPRVTGQHPHPATRRHPALAYP
jgi:O-antigen ligase